MSVSQKIKSSEERKRLRTAVQSIRPRNFGIIIRTVAENKSVEELSADLDMLRYRWDTTVENLFASKAPLRLAQEENRVASLLRDFLNDSFHAIYVDTPEMFTEVKNYLHVHAPEQEEIVSLYNEKRPIFDYFNVAKQIKGSFGKVVPMRQGAYLVIESTEALNVIDVNSGIRTKTNDQEQNSYEVNRMAAEEIARQLRLRDMGGIVIVDFIDMESVDHRNALHKYMQDLMENDRAKHNVLPLTKFGLMQITRQRIRPATEINTLEQCPVCHGTGKIQSSVVIDEEIERRISYFVIEKGIRSISLKTSPILGAYLKRGLFNSFLAKWRKRYKIKLGIEEVTDFSVLQHEMFNDKGEKLE